jgi:predicted dehydrogenase
MVEKPITETIEQARRLAQMADERRLVLQVGHIERFNPAYIELKHGTGDMKLIGVSMRRLSPFGTSNTDVDVIRDLMIHDLDLAVDMVGLEIEGIDAWGRSINTEVIDHAVASLPFKDGSIVTLFVSRVGARGFGE